jgi:outer membrane protein
VTRREPRAPVRPGRVGAAPASVRWTSLPAARLAVLAALLVLPGFAQIARAADGAPVDSLTMDDCVRLARERAPEVQAAGADADAAAFDAQSARRNSRPVFKLFGGATVAPNGFYDPAITNLGQYELKAGVDVPLLDGGGRARARERAFLGSQIADLAREKARRVAAAAAAGLAAEVLRLQERQRAGVRSLEWLDHLASLLKPAAASGAHGAGEVLRVVLEHDALEAELSTTRTDLGAASRELAQLAGIAEPAARALRTPAEAEDLLPGPADSARAVEAADSLPEVRSARLAETQARLDVADAQARDAINIGLSADAGFAGTDLTAVVPGDLKAERADATFLDRLKRDLGASVSVQFSRTVSDPTAAGSLRARDAGLHAAALRAATERENQRRATLDLLQRWRSAAVRRASLQEVVVRADDNLLRSKSLYVAGALSLLELLDARQVAEDARGRLADARAEERKARAEVRIRQ